jgi:hypothetical protein
MNAPPTLNANEPMMIVAILTSSNDRPAVQTRVAVGGYVTLDSLREQSLDSFRVKASNGG